MSSIFDFNERLSMASDMGMKLNPVYRDELTSIRHIYLASSWRNPYYFETLAFLRGDGHVVYDFRNPPERTGFGWEQVAVGASNLPVKDMVHMLESSQIAEDGFRSDFAAMNWADVCVMLMPCGRSAHLELGWAAGAGKRTIIYFPSEIADTVIEPELMHLVANRRCVGKEDLRSALA